MITGKEAKLAWANGDIVGYVSDGNVWLVDENTPLGVFDSFKKWQIKPRTISINGVEVHAPFKPRANEEYWFIADYTSNGYSNTREGTGINSIIGKWRTEEEIKQVVEALRSVFK